MSEQRATSSGVQNQMARFLDAAIAGVTTIITRRGRPVAVLAPLPAETPKEKEEIANE